VTTQTENLLNNREKTYGKSWYITGIILGVLKIGDTVLAQACPEYLFSWILILNKLIRALTSPFDEDHWDDIIGYATLVRNDMSSNDCSCLKGRDNG